MTTTNIDFTSQAYLRDPSAALAKLRAAGPLVQVNFPLLGRIWMTTTQELAERVLKDSEIFKMRREDGGVVGVRWWMPNIVRMFTENMLSADEPNHTRLRAIVDEAFRRRSILAMEPRVAEISGALADELFAQGSPADLVDRYARILPLSVICELLGLPQADRPTFIGWANSFARLSNAVDFFRVIPSMTAMKKYMERRLDVVRREGGEGLIAEIVRVEKEGGQISRDEMVAMLFLLLIAGHETTTHLISGSVYELLRDPGLRDWLAEDWRRAETATEEFLRFVSSVQGTQPRLARKDIELGGVRLKKGDKVMAFLAAANLDPKANDHPEKLDLARKPNRHVAFGAGIHFCLGHQLARMESRCGLVALFKRWPKLALAVDEQQIRWRKRAGLRAIDKLPVVASS